jgi:hypothetical protein
MTAVAGHGDLFDVEAAAAGDRLPRPRTVARPADRDLDRLPGLAAASGEHLLARSGGGA